MLTSLLLLTLSSHSVDFNTPSTIEKRSAFFLSQANENGARVKILKPSAKPAAEQACRRALTLPSQESIKLKLSEKLNLTIPDKVHFIDADINNYQQQKNNDWLNCTGDIHVNSVEVNEAFLALKLAWYFIETKQKQRLRSVIEISLNQPQTKADSIALIASQSPLNKGLAYLDKHLTNQQLHLIESKVAVGNMWLQANKLNEALALLDGCKSMQCTALRNQIIDKQEALESEQADDLRSYF
ncbi:hypothetical protein D5R81_04760 [Parashewanella spongiae]|uniref:Uncharacterized protein n=1 Tax=Parashewanella spongiae TaxID=342950 RepID=A0A3A6TZF6_9GAMM|nr:hypothetical protein [Parashewanella spongiae]MCL1077292.1 hypothetical protein [Parashewanella spongiae]RJY18530.1 hypothetical protein D5R81_04760 [Parashewanella spongiae]